MIYRLIQKDKYQVKYTGLVVIKLLPVVMTLTTCFRDAHHKMLPVLVMLTMKCYKF